MDKDVLCVARNPAVKQCGAMSDGNPAAIGRSFQRSYSGRTSVVCKESEVMLSCKRRETDVSEKFFVRADVTNELPFVVTELSSY